MIPQKILKLQQHYRPKVEKSDQMISTAIEYGESESNEPLDHGWMYGRSFEDIDGHIWE